MDAARDVPSFTTDAEFVSGGAGTLFRVRSRPAVTAAPSRVGTSVLLVAPLAEEMNRSRRFLAALRREIASRGAEAMTVDPFGTGDSAGDFADATWATWREDLLAVFGSLAAERRVLVGVRSGSLLVADALRSIEPLPARVVHVQPERRGRDIVRRWLRARVARGRLAGDRRESVETLGARLEAGETLELGGYPLRPGLARDLSSRELSSHVSPSREASADTHVFELAGTATQGDGREPDTDDPVVIGEDDGWSVHRLTARPFWQLEDSVPEVDVVARIAKDIVR